LEALDAREGYGRKYRMLATQLAARRVVTQPAVRAAIDAGFKKSEA
jgi:hypothetical protein